MPKSSLDQRVEIIEGIVEKLQKLPARMDTFELQFLQFREEVRVEFSATREQLQAEIRAGDEESRRYMRVLHEEVISRIALIQEGLPARKKKS